MSTTPGISSPDDGSEPSTSTGQTATGGADAASTTPRPPVAARRHHLREHHGHRFDDPYDWVRDKSDPEVIALLEAENAYTEAMTAHLEPLRAELFDDIRARTLETDLSVPSFVTDSRGRHWWYYSRTVAGHDYAVHCRVPAAGRDHMPDMDAIASGQLPADEQVVLDGNREAEGHEFFAVGAMSVSPSGDRLAFSVDHAGDEQFDLFVRELATGRTVAGPTAVAYGIAWSGDDQVVYTRFDDAWRPFQVWRHMVGVPDADQLLFEEPDERYWVGAEESRDRRWVVIDAEARLTSEVRLLATDQPEAPPRLVAPRREGLLHYVEVAGDEVFITHNADSPDFQVSRALLRTDGDGPLAPEATWTPWLGPTDGVRYNAVEAYDTHVVVERRRGGLAGLDVVPRDDPGAVRAVEFADPVHEAVPLGEADVDTDRIRIRYESLVTPPSVLEYRFATGELATLRTQPVLDHPRLGAYRAEDYVTERQWATAADGRRIPLSIVRRRDTPLDASAPCLLYGYGAYEISIPPAFSISRLSLLDRGFVYCIAHVRGGGEMGRSWYEEGRLLHKPNSFTDFVSAAHWLVDNHYTAPDRLVAEGRSAGGLLMGAITNLAPDLFAGVHAGVAFVDALTTILDPSLPLTVTEWDEWGDPLHDPEVYACMRGYTPYENVRPGRYPAILATTSLNDTRVLYVEPTKWVQQLRHTTDADPRRPVLQRTEMVAGHAGVSGRYAQWHDRAFELAWIIDTATRSQREPG